MSRVAPDVWRIGLVGSDVVNAYLVGDVLIDSGGRSGSGRLLAALDGHEISAHVITHAHPDHHGGSHAVCEGRGVPLMCGRGDREAMESGNLASVLPNPDRMLPRLTARLGGPGHPVSRVLNEGDRIGDVEVIEAPGHTPGHLAFWREDDRVLILGDVLFHRNPVTLRRGLREPFTFFTHDPALNRASARRLASREPAIVCFGHGAPLTDGERFCRFIEHTGSSPGMEAS